MDPACSDHLLADVQSFLQLARCPSSQHAWAYWHKRPFLSGEELSGLALLLDGRRTAGALTQAFGAKADDTASFLDALVAIGVLEVWQGGFALTEAARLYIDSVMQVPYCLQECADSDGATAAPS